MYIVKNNKVSDTENEYILLTSEKVQFARLEMSPNDAAKFAQLNNLKAISPIEAWLGKAA